MRGWPFLIAVTVLAAGCSTRYVAAGLGLVGGDAAGTSGNGEASVDRASVYDYLTIVRGGKYVQWRFDLGSARFGHLRVTDPGTGDTTDLGQWGFWWFNPASVQVSWPAAERLLVYAYVTPLRDLVDGDLAVGRALEDGGPDYTGGCRRWGIGVRHKPSGLERFFWSVEYRWLQWHVEYWDNFHTGGIVFQIGI